MTIENLNIKKLEHSEIEITAEIPAQEFESFRAGAIKKIGAQVEVAGFRKGHVPEDVLAKKLGDMPVLEEMAERAINKAYAQIAIENKIAVLGSPTVTITKIAKGEGLGFKLVTAVMPEVTLGDYKKVAQAVKPAESVIVEEKEVNEVVEQIRKQRATTLTNNNDKDNEEESAPKEELPELTDGFVQTLGDFKNVDDFKKKIEENIRTEKEARARQKRRMDIMEHILKGTDIEVPKIVVESELDKMMSQFQGDIARMGLKFDEYLKHIKKTHEDLRGEWRVDAERNSKVQIVLNKIASEENIKPEQEKIEKEVAHILEHYKEASEDRARTYVETILTNEAVFTFLENQK